MGELDPNWPPAQLAPSGPNKNRPIRVLQLYFLLIVNSPFYIGFFIGIEHVGRHYQRRLRFQKLLHSEYLDLGDPDLVRLRDMIGVIAGF